jgi:hypothetical protein
MHLSKRLRNFYYDQFDLKKLDLNCQNLDGPIVSLTTVPKRINYIKPTIVSLLKQKIKPKVIEINLGEDLFCNVEIPSFLNDLDCVKIYWQKKDYGPATKLIPTVERYKNKSEKIIIVDDDMFYSENLILDLVNSDVKSNGKQVFCINGFVLSRSLQSDFNGNGRCIKSGCRKVAVIEGCGGYIIRSCFLDCDVLLDINSAPYRTLFEDDIWFSGHLSRVGIEKIQIPTGRRKSLINTVESAIDGDRAKVQTDILQYFKADWKPDEYARTNVAQDLNRD